MKEEKTNAWKVATIILATLLVLSWATMGLLIHLGSEIIEKEAECSVNICDETHDSYYYDDYENICYCIIDGEVAKEKYMS